jgi:hypothetical protein
MNSRRSASVPSSPGTTGCSVWLLDRGLTGAGRSSATHCHPPGGVCSPRATETTMELARPADLKIIATFFEPFATGHPCSQQLHAEDHRKILRADLRLWWSHKSPAVPLQYPTVPYTMTRPVSITDLWVASPDIPSAARWHPPLVAQLLRPCELVPGSSVPRSVASAQGETYLIECTTM